MRDPNDEAVVRRRDAGPGITEQCRLGEACWNPASGLELGLVVRLLFVLVPASVSVTVSNPPAHPGTVDHASDAVGVCRALAPGDAARHSIIFGH